MRILVDIEKSLSFKLLEETVGIPIKIVSNDFEETPGYEDTVNSYQEIIFQIKEEEPDLWAIGVLYTLSLMSFSFATPRGYSAEYFVPDEQWNLGYFVQGLEFRHKHLCFSSDYVSGRLMKTHITFQSGGRVTLTTRNRGRGAERWLTYLQGKKHIKPVS